MDGSSPGTFSSVATHWLPRMIKEFQKNYPNIDYELLLGDYTEIEEWIATGRVDCGFLRIPANPDFDVTFLDQDRLLAVLPENHPFAKHDKFPIGEFVNEPFMLLEKGTRAEIWEVFERAGISPKVHFTTWDDYAIMSMVESGLGVSVLPELKELDVPAFRKIGFAMRNKKTASLAVKRYME